MKKLGYILIFLFYFSLSSAQTIVVDKSGNGNYTSINEAAQIAIAGDTILILPGIYQEVIKPKYSGTQESPICYIGSTEGEVIIQQTNQEFCFDVNQNDFINFYNLIIRNAEVSGFKIAGPSKNILLENIDVSGTKMYDTQDGGLLLIGKKGKVDSITIKNCKIHSNVGHGISILENVTHVLIDNCKVFNNGLISGAHADNIALATIDWLEHKNGPSYIEIRNSEIYGGIRQGISTWFAHHLWIHNNKVWENGATGIQIEDGVENFIIEDNISHSNQQINSTETGIWIDDAKNGTVRNNKLYNNQVGIKISRSKNIIVRNNLIYNNHRESSFKESGGIEILAYKVGNTNIDNENTVIVNNTIYGVGSDIGGYENFMLCFVEADNSIIKNTIIKNNIFTNTVNGTYISDYTWTNNHIDFSSDYNLVFDDEAIKNQHNTFDYTIEELQELGNEKNSLFANPMFYNSDNEIFNLSSTSPCIDNGTFLTKTLNSETGKIIQLENALFFNDGYGIINGDSIKVGDNISLIQKVDYINNIITLKDEISWAKDTPVSLVYYGSKPDMGAIEYNSNTPLATTNIQPILKNSLDVKIFPSPIDINSKILFSTTYDSPISVKITDIRGEVVEKFTLNCSAHQNYELKLMPEKLQCGYYIITLSTDKESVSKKVVKL